MAKLQETWRNCTGWLFSQRDQFAGPINTSGKAYMREWRRRQIESIREAQLRQRSKEQHQD
jgi:hypothetical protein